MDSLFGLAGPLPPFKQKDICQGRLTLESGVPISVTDQSSKSTIYLTPYQGNHIFLFNGSQWTPYTFSETSVTLLDLATGSNYDIFAYLLNREVRILVGAYWYSGTARFTPGTPNQAEIVLQDNVYVNMFDLPGGLKARHGLYLGTFRSLNSSTTADTITQRYLWNNYNRASRNMRVTDAAASSAYTTTAWRQANANSANSFFVVRGLNEDTMEVTVGALGQSSTVYVGVGVGLDNTTALASDCVMGGTFAIGGALATCTAFYRGYPGLGYHVLSWIEYGGSGGNFYYTNTPVVSGMVGNVQC